MHDELVRILSPLLVVAAIAATQAMQPASHNSLAASLVELWNQEPEATAICHGTRLGNSRGSGCTLSAVSHDAPPW